MKAERRDRGSGGQYRMEGRQDNKEEKEGKEREGEGGGGRRDG